MINDDDPYHTDCTPDTVQTTDQHLSAFLTEARKSWKSYQEDTDVDAHQHAAAGEFVDRSAVQPERRLCCPGGNAYNYSNQYNYAAKHNPMVFFTDTNGGCNTTTSNPLRPHYAPLQQLALDLPNNTVADYNWITPDQYNDQHTALTNGYGQYPNSAARPISPTSHRETISWLGSCP